MSIQIRFIIRMKSEATKFLEIILECINQYFAIIFYASMIIRLMVLPRGQFSIAEIRAVVIKCDFQVFVHQI